MEKPSMTQRLDLRADGAALDIESTRADLYLNNNDRSGAHQKPRAELLKRMEGRYHRTLRRGSRSTLRGSQPHHLYRPERRMVARRRGRKCRTVLVARRTPPLATGAAATGASIYSGHTCRGSVWPSQRSIPRTWAVSAGVIRVNASPSAPARAVRPTRWT